MKQQHLSDDELIDACLGLRGGGDVARHLARCGECEVRRVTLADMLSDVTMAMNAEADALFPPERLARQQARILQQIEQDGRPGRVIAFPTGPAQPAPSLLRTNQTTRWIAAAAAAAFVVGVLAGHLMPRDFGATPPHVVVAHPAKDTPTGTTLRASTSLTPSDDEFLGEVEVAVESTGPAGLRRLDALTPRSWDVEVGQ